jgi:hypothetical protein
MVGIRGGNYSDKVGVWDSNYVDRINTTLTTSIGVKQDILTTTVLYPYFNSDSFYIKDNKINSRKLIQEDLIHLT